MKRFVDLRGQATGYRFAWFDTYDDHFEEFDTSQAWDTWDEFADDYAHTANASELSRYRGLCPEWVFLPEPKYGTWTTCSCGHIAQAHDKAGKCEEADCVCLKYDGVCTEGGKHGCNKGENSRPCSGKPE